MDEEVDLGLLTHEEKVEYSRLGHPRRLRLREANRAPRTWGAFALWAVVTVGLWLAIIGSRENSTPAATTLFVIFLIVMLGGLVPVILVARSESKDISARYQAEFLDQIEYSNRRQAKTEGKGVRNEPYKSRRRMQHEWYGDHTELTWRDREIGEMHGIDADTYVSNVLENDKD